MKNTVHEKISDRARKNVLNVRIPFIIHGYFEALRDLISIANTLYGFALIPEKIY